MGTIQEKRGGLILPGNGIANMARRGHEAFIPAEGLRAFGQRIRAASWLAVQGAASVALFAVMTCIAGTGPFPGSLVQAKAMETVSASQAPALAETTSPRHVRHSIGQAIHRFDHSGNTPFGKALERACNSFDPDKAVLDPAHPHHREAMERRKAERDASPAPGM